VTVYPLYIRVIMVTVLLEYFINKCMIPLFCYYLFWWQMCSNSTKFCIYIIYPNKFTYLNTFVIQLAHSCLDNCTCNVKYGTLTRLLWLINLLCTIRVVENACSIRAVEKHKLRSSMYNLIAETAVIRYNLPHYVPAGLKLALRGVGCGRCVLFHVDLCWST